MSRSRSQDFASNLIRTASGPPAFRIHGRAVGESAWRIIDIYATPRRDAASRWPLWRNHCITWTASVVAVGCDFAHLLLREQEVIPATRERPCTVVAGRLKDRQRRLEADGPEDYNCSELLAHECGHTGQAMRAGFLYWPLVGPLTMTREGRGWIHYFENGASETGQFGGIIPGSFGPGWRTDS